MSSRRAMLALFMSLAAGVIPAGVQAAQQTTKVTTIRVSDMHCANCARKIAGKLVTVSGVLQVRTHLASHTATISPQQTKQPSPKAMWEAVEKAGFKPVKLEGPSGVFTEKPAE